MWVVRREAAGRSERCPQTVMAGSPDKGQHQQQQTQVQQCYENDGVETGRLGAITRKVNGMLRGFSSRHIRMPSKLLIGLWQMNRPLMKTNSEYKYITVLFVKLEDL